ncbi:YigZ family protein [Garciella nitratireducens]|uniref:Uncharacterized protein, YigZ family n=1 Tax=Garciella nitratireducens DSM 15102 TaxID=1121911 RepID=A0A1T4K216_9FIRM|nr:YigZ family protein [Garciella nitratireducens]RBP46621.1 putative YigZ family protein [Garciella nitratireducens]SJZ36419.1 uncharacterized protein, YigZ family [Garciella nitratireducens DSM 15102]
MDEQYFSIKNSIKEVEIIEKSKFIVQAFPVSIEEEALFIIDQIKKEHYKATHNVPAYIIGKRQEIQKCSDDGEPSSTAGIPILEIIKKENLTNILIVVTRYFGGIKLGAGGLIRAYAHMAKKAIDHSEIVKYVLCQKIVVVVDYIYWGKLENKCNILGLYIDKVDFLEKVYIYIYLQENQRTIFLKQVEEITNGQGKIHLLEKEYIKYPC